ncbi:hypothetical protein [Nocardia nova]|uniref:hypothetical protein n=1 Tax=Nocardia nova TaxID=37330 RepID=UPI003405B6EA
MTDSSAFIEIIAELDYTLSYDRRTALREFTAALTIATPAEREVLDTMLDAFTRYPYSTALLRLDAAYRYDPAQREILEELLPGTDPGLFMADRADRIAVLEQRAARNGTSVADEAFAEHAPLTVVDSAPVPMRQWRNPPARMRLAPSRETDKSRMSREQIAARVLARGKRRPALIEPDVVASYATDNLYRDTMARELADNRAAEQRLLERGLITEPATSPVRVQGSLPLPEAEVAERWDYELVHYVADQYIDDTAHAGRRPVSHDESLDYAEARTTLRGDRRPPMPFHGNAIDYTHEAMTAVSGWRCVSCFIERATTDQRIVHTRDGHLRSDDGLCDYCRSGDTTTVGLPELPAGFTAADLARTYCRYLTDTYPGTGTGVLTETRRRAPRWLTAIIDDFLPRPEQPQDATESAAPQAQRAPRRRGPLLGAGQRQARCEGCTRIRGIHDDGFCTECRVWLGLVTPPARQPVAA